MARNPQDAQAVQAIAFELTLLMGEIWQAEITDYYSDNLTNLAGERLWIEYNDRIHISPANPQGVTINVIGDRPHITISRTRTATEQAQDIARRMLPPAREYWQKARHRQTNHDAEVAATTRTVEEIQSRDNRAQISRHDSSETRAKLWTPEGSIEVYSGEIYNIEIRHIKKEIALFLIAYLANTREQE